VLVLVTGGTASGKSEIAEDLAVELARGRKAYVATLRGGDPESERRVAKHRRQRRGKGFITYEIPVDLLPQITLLKFYDTVLIECLTNLVANEMYLGNREASEAAEVVWQAVQKLQKNVNNLVIVSGTVFAGTRAYDPFTEKYLEALGTVNCGIALAADIVIESVCAIPVVHKGQEKILLS